MVKKFRRSLLQFIVNSRSIEDAEFILCTTYMEFRIFLNFIIKGKRKGAKTSMESTGMSSSKKEVSTTEPKWKERTQNGVDIGLRRSNGHLQQLEILASKDSTFVETLLLGDSMLERWKTTPNFPVEFVDNPSVFNAGIGGDRIENILWRIVPNDNKAIPNKSNPIGLLSLLPSIKQIIFFVGTNNMALSPPSSEESYERGIRLLLTHILDFCSSSLRRVIVVALPSHSAAAHFVLSQKYNIALQRICSDDSFNSRGILQYCDELVGFSDDNYEFDCLHFNSKGYEQWYPLLRSHISSINEMSGLDSKADDADEDSKIGNNDATNDTITTTANSTSDYEDELMRALEESASLHQQTITYLGLTTFYEKPRSDISVDGWSCPEECSGRMLRQINTINQFHTRWNPAIERFEAPSAICGYTSIAGALIVATMAAGEYESRTAESLKERLSNTEAMDVYVEQSMDFIHQNRNIYIDSHKDLFTDKTSMAYKKAWVANYEISDFFRATDPAISKHVIFVRYNQYGDYQVATFEEKVRLLDEESFGPFIFEEFTNADGDVKDRQLLRPEDFFRRKGIRAPWRVALIDLSGHFAIAVPVEGGIVLYNTTDSNYLPGAKTVALALDAAFKL